MNIKKFGDLITLRDQITDAKLRAKFDKAMSHLLNVPAAEHRQRAFAYWSVVGTLVVFGIATGTIAILATLKLIEVDKMYLTWCWAVFSGDLVLLATWLVRQSWKNPR